MKEFIKENWFKILIVIVLSLITSIFILSNRYYFIQKGTTIIKCDKFTGNCEQKSLIEEKLDLILPSCNFEINNVIKDGNYYKGLIKNNSTERHLLKAMIAKIYNSEGVLVASGYESIGDYIEPDKSLSFKIHTFLENDSSLKRDIYPWFSTCK